MDQRHSIYVTVDVPWIYDEKHGMLLSLYSRLNRRVRELSSSRGREKRGDPCVI